MDISCKGFLAGVNIITTDHSDYKKAKDNDWRSRIWGQNKARGAYDNTTKRISSAFYIGYRNGQNSARIGIDNPYIQDFFQNGFHLVPGFKTPFFPTDYATKSRLYSFSGNAPFYMF